MPPMNESFSPSCEDSDKFIMCDGTVHCSEGEDRELYSPLSGGFELVVRRSVKPTSCYWDRNDHIDALDSANYKAPRFSSDGRNVLR